ncbi:hypothetical protein EDD37DRAFT_440979 [Exophiala viscosa]|uniref:uncharacterized protein n=1 Tax=Exophiala viscosa TaxID=2486360 RepID=UPI002195C562|nr:hypothetical protein EDD37DRAFT_440979 [Exophiala viscosa]
MPANGQALIDPGQPLFPFDLGFTLAEIGQGQYLEVQNNAYANPSQYISLPYSDSPSQLNGHAGHQQYSDTHQAQYAGCPVHDSGLSHLNGPDVHQQYFVDTHQPQYKANHPHDMGPSHLNGHAGRQQYLSTTQPQYTSGPVANNDARHRAAQISQQPFTPATNTFSFTAPDSSEKQVAPGEDAWGIDSFDPGTWPMLGPNGMAWPPPRPPHP